LVGVKGRSGSGGVRPNSGRRYRPIRLDYVIEGRDGLIRLYRDVIRWNLEHRIDHVRARTTLIALEGLAKVLMPSEFEVQLSELRKDAEATRRILESAIGMEAVKKLGGEAGHS